MGRVMVVDDEPDMRMAVRLILERHGHTVEEVASGEDACQRIQGAPPDLLLMDVRMPGQDGLETLGKIRESNKTMPVIIMTGYGNPETEQEAFRKGATNYILKPFRNEQLLDAISKIGLNDHSPQAAKRPETLVQEPEFQQRLSPSPLSGFLRHVLNVFRHARDIFVDRWHNPPIHFERDPSLEESISLRLSIIVDPLRVIVYGLFDKDFELHLEEAIQAQNLANGQIDAPESASFDPASMDGYSATPAPAIKPPAFEPEVERVHHDLSQQIQNVAQSLQAEIGRLAEQMRQQQAAPKAVDPPVTSSGSRESPQEEFHRLLIELQSSWSQDFTALSKDLSVSSSVIHQWRKALPAAQGSSDSSDIAPTA